MQLDQLFSCDSSLKLQSPNNWERPLAGVSTPAFFSENSVIFVKNRKFYKKILEKKDRIPTTVGAIFEESLWQSLDQSVGELEGRFAFVATCADATLLMTHTSKILYDEKIEPLDFFNEARQGAAVGENCKIAPTAFIGEKVTIGNNVRIHPGCVVMPEVTIGDNCELFPNVTIYCFTKLGRNVRIHAGTSIGADGFGYNFYNGVHEKLWHSGGVIIQDNVEIGANSCVDMGTFTPTVIGQGVKIDNQVQIAHNVELGVGVIICGQSGIAGSSSVGPYTVMGGQSGITNDVNIGGQCHIGGFSSVISNLDNASKVAGTPARPFNEWLAGLAYVRRESLKKKK